MPVSALRAVRRERDPVLRLPLVGGLPGSDAGRVGGATATVKGTDPHVQAPRSSRGVLAMAACLAYGFNR